MTEMQSKETRVLIDVAKVARMLSVSTRTVWRLVSAGKLPAPIRVGRSVRWCRAAIDAWISQGCPETDTSSSDQNGGRS